MSWVMIDGCWRAERAKGMNEWKQTFLVCLNGFTSRGEQAGPAIVFDFGLVMGGTAARQQAKRED